MIALWHQLIKLKQKFEPWRAMVWHYFGRGRAFLPIVGLAYSLGIAAYYFVWISDPFFLRTGLDPIRLSDVPVSDKIVPRLVSVAVHDGADFLIIGGSTSMGFTPSMMRAAFPAFHHPVNLSFVAIRKDELAQILARVETSKTIKRIIVTLDFTLIKDFAWIKPKEEMRYYQRAKWYNPVPEFDLPTVSMAVSSLVRGTIGDNYFRKNPDRPDFISRDEPVTANGLAMTKLVNAANVSRAWVTSQPELNCSAIPSIKTIIKPFAQRMSNRGVHVDFVFMPYSLAVYSDWTVNFPNGEFFSGKGAVWSNLMALRHCAVEATSGIPNVEVHAFDTDLSLVGDMSRYRDSSHLNDMSAFPYLLKRIAQGNAVLTPSNWQAYADQLKKSVDNFRP